MAPIVSDLVTLERQGQIRERMSIQAFLNPITENVHDQEEDVFEAIVNCFDTEQEAESDEKPVEEVAIVSPMEALSALQTLKTYEEQQEHGDATLTKTLRRKERELQLCKTAGLCQSNLDSWFGGLGGSK